MNTHGIALKYGVVHTIPRGDDFVKTISENVDHIYTFTEAQLTALIEDVRCPEGWKLVPIELTPEMVATWHAPKGGDLNGFIKLYEVTRNSRVITKSGQEFNFHHIDGMYSYCTDDEGQLIHLSANTEVKIIGVNK